MKREDEIIKERQNQNTLKKRKCFMMPSFHNTCNIFLFEMFHKTCNISLFGKLLIQKDTCALTYRHPCTPMCTTLFLITWAIKTNCSLCLLFLCSCATFLCCMYCGVEVVYFMMEGKRIMNFLKFHIFFISST